MRWIGKAIGALAAVLMLIPAASAGDTDPLFLNLTTDNGHRASMAVSFSRKQQERKHPVTVFLNDRGVMLGVKSGAKKFKDQQATLAAIMKDGGSVLICANCMKKYGVKETDLLEGIKVGNPDVMGAALFKDNTKTLTW